MGKVFLYLFDKLGFVELYQYFGLINKCVSKSMV